jgi:flagellar hook-length control protein FliK
LSKKTAQQTLSQPASAHTAIKQLDTPNKAKNSTPSGNDAVTPQKTHGLADQQAKMTKQGSPSSDPMITEAARPEPLETKKLRQGPSDLEKAAKDLVPQAAAKEQDSGRGSDHKSPPGQGKHAKTSQALHNKASVALETSGPPQQAGSQLAAATSLRETPSTGKDLDHSPDPQLPIQNAAQQETLKEEKPAALLRGFKAELQAVQSRNLAELPKVSPPALPTQLELPTPIQSPQFGHNFGAEVVLLAAQGVQQASIRLNPEDLGPIQIDIRLQDQQVDLMMAAALPETRQAVQATQDVLRTLFLEQGLHLAQFDVQSQLSGSAQQQFGHQSGSQPPSAHDIKPDHSWTTAAGEPARTVYRQGLLNLVA